MNHRPLGVGDLVLMPFESGVPKEAYADHWYWCRKHEKAEHVSEPADIIVAGAATMYACIRVGPFMSEREALRLTTPGAPYGKTVKHLGMEVES